MNNQKERQSHYDRRLVNQYTNFKVQKEGTLLNFLMEGVGLSRTKAKQLLSQKMVYIDKIITTQWDAPVQVGQLVQLAKRGNLHQLRSRFVKILYEDAFLLVVEKAEGILTNAIPGSRDNSLKRILDEYVKRENKALSVHTVHRLDRVTSGILIFAKRRDIQQAFTDRWHDMVTDRRYIAVVQGRPKEPTGTISSWLTDNKMFVSYSSPIDNGGKYAVTHYKTLKWNEKYALVELKLETGRKNQIRVHMQDLGCPVVGDLKYGSDEDPIGRVCLHARKIEFFHPITGEQLKFETPIPAKFASLVK